MSSEATVWCVVGKDFTVVSTTNCLRRDAIREWLATWDAQKTPRFGRWKYWYGKGMRCRKFRLVEAEQ
jgi:hypothetical protein